MKNFLQVNRALVAKKNINFISNQVTAGSDLAMSGHFSTRALRYVAMVLLLVGSSVGEMCVG